MEAPRRFPVKTKSALRRLLGVGRNCSEVCSEAALLDGCVVPSPEHTQTGLILDE